MATFAYIHEGVSMSHKKTHVCWQTTLYFTNFLEIPNVKFGSGGMLHGSMFLSVFEPSSGKAPCPTH